MRAALKTAVQPQSGPRPRLDNPGLALDRYLGQAGDDGDRHSLLQDVAAAGVAAGFRLRYDRWLALLRNQPHCRLGIFETAGRLIVGMGAESVHDIGIVLQHVDGVPYLPGSALKGLAAHYLARSAASGSGAADASDDLHNVLFGTTSGAGYVTYFDAWYVPASAPDDRPLALDTITVHHPAYYTGRERREPADLDDPNPLPFLSVRGRFLVAVAGPDADWSAFAFTLLRQALGDWGIGAKTSSGYGRLEWVEDIAPSLSPAAIQAAALQAAADHPLIRTLQSMPPARMRSEIGGIVQQAERLAEPAKTTVLRAVAKELRKEQGLWRWAQGRRWFETVAPYAAPPETGNNL